MENFIMMKNLACWPLASLLLAVSCGGGGGGGSGGTAGSAGLKMVVTDDPFPIDVVKEAHVHVSAVKIQKDASADDGFTDLDVGSGIDLDLLSLRNGVTATLTDQFTSPGSIGQIRLVIDSASLTLTNDAVYSTDNGNLQLTSDKTSGLKLFVDPPIEIVAGQTTNVLLDFDLTKTFHAVPPTDPLSANKFLLMPGVRVTSLVDAGDIRGVVTKDDGTGTQVGVDMANVYVLPPGDTDTNDAVATTATEADGSYAFLGIAPGTYDVLATKDALKGTAAGITVVKAQSTTVDISIQ
jgi:uncharacterized protein DUF4382/carboxypeptidase family protein